MNPNDKHLFVVRAVEDRDLSARRDRGRVPPQVVVSKLLSRGYFEPVDRDALRVDSTHHMADRAVLAGSVHRLQNHEHTVCRLCCEPRLEVGQQRNPLLEQLLGTACVVAGVPPCRPRVEVPGEAHLGSRTNHKGLYESFDPLWTEVAQLA